jgi:H+-translocating NAD(P) transhydrogenase subunit alpha
VLITEEMVAGDEARLGDRRLAAEQGGNCELTVPGEVVEHHGRDDHRLHRPAEPPRPTASQLYGSTSSTCSRHGRREELHVDLDDEVVARRARRHEGEVHVAAPPRPRIPPGADLAPEPHEVPPPERRAEEPPKRSKKKAQSAAPHARAPASSLLALGVGRYRPALRPHLTVFVLACFVGWQVVWNVTPALHTPLMSVTNAISGIIIIGGMLQAGSGPLDRPRRCSARPPSSRDDQHRGRVPRHPAHAAHVPQSSP